ncbi:MAG TPA: isopentenyl phosphate kinase [Thermoanaerobaculia bacterium]|nr:isopentenyl phosphate kinase [Thermoanaerobaculia bacterium]
MDIVLLKLGGSLITEKSRAETPRPEVIARLAGEIARAAGQVPFRLVAGHGSGSFGHVAARESGIAQGLHSREQLPGVSRTQERAAALHHLVIQALEEAGALPFSLAPSSCMVAAAGRPVAIHDEPLLLALESGLLPVLYGDVVMDRERGVSICSTETVFDAVARRLLERGHAVRRAVWLGETDGLYDAEGKTIPRVSAAELDRSVLGDPSGTDVTGGMRHRIESALELARMGVPSLLINGLRAGELERALRGEAVQGTEVV